MAVAYTARVRFGNAATRARVVEGLCSLLQHLESFQNAPLSIVISPADGIVTVTLAKAISRDQLEHLGLNNDGAETP